MNPSDALIAAAKQLRDTVSALQFSKPVTHVYNPLLYAWDAHEAYLKRYGTTPRRTLFLGMNPGPFGMAQTGVPFGEVRAVTEWLKIKTRVEKPRDEHPKRPVHGFDCTRSEVSGRRLWGLFRTRFGAAEDFFREHFVVNYCPLVFMESSGCNRTPDKLPAKEASRLYAACDAHLRTVADILKPDWLVGVGDFAEKRIRDIFPGSQPRRGKILHPSPASPAANRDWAGTATAQLHALGVW